MTYFTRRKSVIKVWDESKHPREPAGSDKGGEFASGGGKQQSFNWDHAAHSKPVPAKPGAPYKEAPGAHVGEWDDPVPAKESFTEYTTRVFGKPKAGTPGSALPGMTIGDVLAHKATAPKLTASGHRPLSTIAREIRRDWGPKVYFGAKPYLDALSSLSDIRDDYGLDPAKQIVAYFLGNATGWRGPKAREIKAELKKLLK